MSTLAFGVVSYRLPRFEKVLSTLGWLPPSFPPLPGQMRDLPQAMHCHLLSPSSVARVSHLACSPQVGGEALRWPSLLFSWPPHMPQMAGEARRLPPLCRTLCPALGEGSCPLSRPLRMATMFELWCRP